MKGNPIAWWKCCILLSTGQIFEEGLLPPEVYSTMCFKAEITHASSGLKYMVTYWLLIENN